MENHVVVCIARQFGSGGRDIGRALAEEMGIRFYDKELLQNAAAKSGILQELFERNDEKPISGLQGLVAAPDGAGKAPSYTEYLGFQPNERLQQVVSDVIRDAAAEGPCVIIGRCADYVLRGQQGMLSVFIHAALDLRVQRVSKLHKLDEDAARSLIRKTDRSRANYYSFYTDRDWGSINNYHLAVDAGTLGIPTAVALLRRAAELKMSGG